MKKDYNVTERLIIEAYDKGYRVNKKGEIISPFNGVINGRVFNNGRLHFVLRTEDYNYSKAVPAHKLQAYQKYGDKIFEEGIVVRHFNGDCLDNSEENILIGTHSDNMMDVPEEIRIKKATIASRKRQNDIRSFKERCLIYEDLKNGIPYNEILKRHNLNSKGTLSFMKNKSIEYQEFINANVAQ